MIKEIDLKNFKGFKELKLNEMRRISLISGKNNVGKSSLLDAFFLMLGHQTSDVFLKLARFRAVSYATPNELWDSLFYNKDTNKPFYIGFQYRDEGNATLEYVRAKDITFINDIKVPLDVMASLQDAIRNNYSLQFSFTHNEYKETGYSIVSSSTILNKITTSKPENALERMPNALYINSLLMSVNQEPVAWIGYIETHGLKSRLVDALKILDPSVIDVVTLSMGGPAQLYIRTGNTTLPLFLAGDGLKRMLYLVAAIIANPNTLILIDEIENGFHYSLYKQIWELLIILSKQYDCQLIITTHSHENISSALEEIKSARAENDFCYYRLDCNDGNQVEAVRYDVEVLKTALETNLEIR